MSEIHQDAEGNIVVTRLRPMSEAPRDFVRILVVHGENRFVSVAYHNDVTWIVGRDGLHECFLEGWIPMPIYKPGE